MKGSGSLPAEEMSQRGKGGDFPRPFPWRQLRDCRQEASLLPPTALRCGIRSSQSCLTSSTAASSEPAPYTSSTRLPSGQKALALLCSRSTPTPLTAPAPSSAKSSNPSTYPPQSQRFNTRFPRNLTWECSTSTAKRQGAGYRLPCAPRPQPPPRAALCRSAQGY